MQQPQHHQFQGNWKIYTRQLVLLLIICFITLFKTMAGNAQPDGEEIILDITIDIEAVPQNSPNHEANMLSKHASTIQSAWFFSLLSQSVPNSLKPLGAMIPNMSFFNEDSTEVTSTQTPVSHTNVISFYDLSWIPYCLTQWIVALALIGSTYTWRRVAAWMEGQAP